MIKTIPESDRSKLNILVVDDIKSARKALSGLLRHLGFINIIECEECEEALNRLNENQVDLVLSDLNLNTCTGVGLLEKMRSISAHKETPFILVTSEKKGPSINDLKEKEISGFLFKPFNSAELMEKIESALYFYYEEQQ